jgi:hypothetical protein
VVVSSPRHSTVIRFAVRFKTLNNQMHSMSQAELRSRNRDLERLYTALQRDLAEARRLQLMANRFELQGEGDYVAVAGSIAAAGLLALTVLLAGCNPAESQLPGDVLTWTIPTARTDGSGLPESQYRETRIQVARKVVRRMERDAELTLWGLERIERVIGVRSAIFLSHDPPGALVHPRLREPVQDAGLGLAREQRTEPDPDVALAIHQAPREPRPPVLLTMEHGAPIPLDHDRARERRDDRDDRENNGADFHLLALVSFFVFES